MSPMTTIGICIACARAGVLDRGVCEGCLRPPRGRRWAEMAARVRKDPQFALAVFRRITTARGRALYALVFGVPPGAAAEKADA